MARLPSELNARMLAQSQELADHWERLLDEYIDGLTEVDSDGSFTYEDIDPDRMTPGALAELRRRYGGSPGNGWELRYDPSNPGEVEFIPRGQGAASGRLDR